ncbi:MAG: hypothetical protein WDN27_02050 [Candidatus Saccharibacteria bacterium]
MTSLSPTAPNGAITTLAGSSVAGGYLTITPDASYDGWRSASTYDFTGKGALVQLISAPTNPAGGNGTATGASRLQAMVRTTSK